MASDLDDELRAIAPRRWRTIESVIQAELAHHPEVERKRVWRRYESVSHAVLGFEGNLIADRRMPAVIRRIVAQIVADTAVGIRVLE